MRALAWHTVLFVAISLTLACPASALEKPRSPVSRIAKPSPFAKYIETLWHDAEQAGVSRKTFDAAFRGVTYDPKVVANTGTQPEFVIPIWDYLKGALSSDRVAGGRAKYQALRGWVRKAHADFGVSEGVIMGIWGLETNFGAFSGGNNVIRSLTSLAFAHYQEDYFRSEIIYALEILEEGDIEPKRMLGSWAGAMGQTQFMPSSFLKFAVDFDGHGRRDIWGDAADAIGSTANYLKQHGWTPGLPWGFEVHLPDGFALRDADSSQPAPFAAFAKRGVTRADGGAMPDTGEARLLILAGLGGPVFLITSNFQTIKSYNNSTSYALAVGLLGDEILGGEGVRAPWPVKDPQLKPTEITELQTQLKRLGFEVGDIDGLPGEALRGAVRKYQEKVGEPPDGYASLALLKRLEKK
jgi:lytic murein transglycosylase